MPGQGGVPGGAGTTTAAAADPWRATDAAALARSWDRARAGSALTVVLTGDAGAGKTQLVRGLAARAEDDGGIVITGSAVDVGEQLPLWPVATGLRRLARAADDAPDRVLAARAALEPWREELRPLLDGGTTPAPSGGQLLELVRRVLVGLAARAPVLLVIDDLHWADRTTRELVVSLVAHLSDERVLVVATARSDTLDVTHPLRRMLPELARDRAVRLIELSPLPHDAVATIVRDDGGDADLAGLVWRRSGGNAFIVAETLAAVAEGAADGLSPGLRGLVLGRLAGLGPVAQRVVAALSLGEEPVSHRLLAEVVRAADEDELLAALRESAEAAMVVVDPDVEGYGLRHGLMRDVVAAELMPGERRSLHRRYALAFDGVAGNDHAAPDTADPAVALRRAHHWARADDPERALPAVVHAAELAEQMHEFGTAHRQWMAALELSDARRAPATVARAHAPRALPPADHEANALLRHAADTAHLAGEYDAAVDLLRRLVPDSATVGRTELPSAVRLGRTLLDAGRTGDAVHVLHDAGLAATRIGDDPALSSVHAAHAEALLVTGEVRGAQREVERALEVSRRRGEQPEQAPMLATLGFALAYLESPDRGLAAVAEGLMIAERTGDGAAVGRAYQAWADLLSGPLGELHEGVEIARQGVARMRDLGLARSAGVRLLATTANGLFRLGRWSEASDAVDEAWALSPTGADALEVRLARCRLQVGRGEFGAADEDLRAVDLLALDGTGEDPVAEDPATDDPTHFVADPGDTTEPTPLAPRRGTVASRYRVPLLTLRSGVEMWRGRPDLARDLVARGLDVAEHTPDDVFLVAPLVWHGLRAEAEAVAHGMATDRAALDRLQRHVAHLERRVPHTLPALRRTVLAYVRMCHAEAGRAAGASDPLAWAQVAQAWSALLHPYPAAYALLRRAEALLATGARRGEAARALRTAAETATAMGAAPFLDEIAGLARRARLDVVHAGDAVVTTRDDGPGPASRRAPELSSLTSREHEVLAVLAEGLSNRQIAQRLYISERTVAVHVSRVLAKTDTRSRTQAAALLQRVRARPTGSDRGPRA
ncbi:helix-turn-helix transcriptional regulator [Actinomycetospora callitridis]|uniref:helix-turn-helix transcriptional regulator n=1 Tax=Actinomycetospora callitridis TaxID=913944 RepID=UPI0023670619|nr:AAA family ATPase [Actinomycetospora callitridis]MDD7921639.1 AAA family ATPase [Actinomycetospora callitridis]